MSSNLATPLHSTPEEPQAVIIPPLPVNGCDPLFFPYHKPLGGSPQFSVTPSPMSWFASSPHSIRPTEAKLAAASMASPDVMAVADLFGTLKYTLKTLRTMFGSLARQTEKMASLGPAIKAAAQVIYISPFLSGSPHSALQVDDVRAKLEKQIQRQEASMQEVRLLLESVIQENLIRHLKVQISGTIQDAIAKEVKERVRREVLRMVFIILMCKSPRFYSLLRKCRDIYAKFSEG